MKNVKTLSMAVLFLAATTINALQASAEKDVCQAIKGITELQEAQYGNEGEGHPDNIRVLKIMQNGVYFVRYINQENDQVVLTHGGKYECLDNSQVSSHIIFSTTNATQRRGMSGLIDYKINDEQIVMEGTIGENTKLHEVWTHVEGDEDNDNSIEGMWKVSSRKYGDNILGEDEPIEFYKAYEGDTVVVVAYNTETKNVLFTHGGTYTFDGRNLVETIKFRSTNAATLGEYTFQVEIQEDQFTQKGETNGTVLEEVWNYVK